MTLYHKSIEESNFSAAATRCREDHRTLRVSGTIFSIKNANYIVIIGGLLTMLKGLLGVEVTKLNERNREWTDAWSHV